MAKLKWPDESFEEKVKALIRDHLQPLASECKEQEHLLVLCIAYITSGVRLMHDMGYDPKEIEARLMMTIDMVMLTAGLAERDHCETVH